MLQRALLKLYGTGVLGRPGRRLLSGLTWQVEAGEAAGLKLGLPQNLDFIRGSSELPIQRCVAENLAPGRVFYDVGANVGFFSLLAARRVGPQGAVYAFEPVSENVAAIRRNSRLNELTNLSVFEVALDAQSGRAELLLTRWDGGSALATASVAPPDSIERRMVAVSTLDELVESENLRPPSVVKIDVEGAEQGVLQGMLRTIAEFKPILVYEVDDGDEAAFVRRWRALDQFVCGLGYHVTHLEDSYANVGWHVGHSLARPLAASGA